MRGANGDPAAKTKIAPKITRKNMTGNSHHFFLAFRKLYISLKAEINFIRIFSNTWIRPYSQPWRSNKL